MNINLDAKERCRHGKLIEDDCLECLEDAFSEQCAIYQLTHTPDVVYNELLF